jgi:uncharacterized protein YyaL (SSP411 family)
MKPSEAGHRRPNALVHETSPYLLQHAYNPVDWYPWGEAALAKARTENKPLLVSIGYSACHWCHVMERESFEDPELAELMNRHFVCIKVDREERPDVDQLYMEAVQLLTGRGGWPLNCFALPDGRPLWGGTYFPPAQWRNVLQHLSQAWQNQPADAARQAERLVAALQESERAAAPAQPTAVTPQELSTLYLTWANRFDLTWGGSGEAPKFPLPVQYRFLMRFARRTGSAQAADFVRLSLKRMAQGGLYDQAGGGFARYSVDGLWHVPHFEKMLYDNAQLVRLYAEAHTWNPDEPLYRQVVDQTLAFIDRELTSPEGLTYAALDADSEGEEGKFYCWTFEDFQAALNSEDTEEGARDVAVAAAYYNVTEGGNWEHGQNVLMRTLDDQAFCRETGLTMTELFACRTRWQSRLLAARAARVRPGLDDKCLLGWNAQLVTARLTAYRAFGTPDYLTQALQALHALEVLMSDGLQLYRTYKNGTRAIPAFLEDYALYIEALLQAYRTTFQENFLQRARVFTDYVLTHFWDEASGFFYFTSSTDTPLFARKKELHDTVLPSSNSVMANNLYELGVLYQTPHWVELASRMVTGIKPIALKHGGSFAHWAWLMMHLAEPPAEVVISGPAADSVREVFDRIYLPDAVLCGTSGQVSALPLLQNRLHADATRIYICRNHTCGLPLTSAEEALAELGALPV